MCLALADAGPWISNSISLHNWNINHMEKENEVENKPLKLFSWPAGFLLFTNFLHSTRNIFPFFFLLYSPLFRALLLVRQKLDVVSWFKIHSGCFCSCDFPVVVIIIILKIENLLFCSARLLIQSLFFLLSFIHSAHLKDFTVIVWLKQNKTTNLLPRKLWISWMIIMWICVVFLIITTEILIKYWKISKWIVKMVI